MAGPKQARSASRPAKSGADAARPDSPRRPGPASPKPGNRTAQGRATPAAAGRAGKPGQNGGPPRARPRSGIATAEPQAHATPARTAPRWFQLTTLALSLAGLGVSIYLTIVHYSSSNLLVCSDKGTINCEKVITSPESMVFGVFPVAVLGLAFYVFMVAINTPWAWRSRLPAVGWARLGGIITGIGFVLYLLYAELVQIGNICLWCTGVHAITFLLFVLLVFHATLGTGITAKEPR
jgi:uncharacterized membrane protein